MRLIDADALKEEVDAWWCPDMSVREIWDVIDSVPTIGGWISVTDSLPEPDGDSSFSQMMLANLIYEGGGPCLINAMYDTAHGEWVHDMPVTGGKITHWMPCPEPPEEVSGDE